MKLQAKVTRIAGTTVHRRAQLSDGKVVPGSPSANPVSVEIVSGSSGVLLLYLDEGGACVADTWHPDEAAAKRQAEFEFDIHPADWTEVTN